jgi:hypothetical protein
VSTWAECPPRRRSSLACPSRRRSAPATAKPRAVDAKVQRGFPVSAAELPLHAIAMGRAVGVIVAKIEAAARAGELNTHPSQLLLDLEHTTLEFHEAALQPVDALVVGALRLRLDPELS